MKQGSFVQLRATSPKLPCYTSQLPEPELSLLNPRTLYSIGSWRSRTGLFRSSREEAVSVTTEPVPLRVITAETVQRINPEFSYLHLGLIVVGLKGLTRRGIGGKVLVVIIDKRHQNTEKSGIRLGQRDNLYFSKFF